MPATVIDGCVCKSPKGKVVSDLKHERTAFLATDETRIEHGFGNLKWFPDPCSIGVPSVAKNVFELILDFVRLVIGLMRGRSLFNPNANGVGARSNHDVSFARTPMA